MLPRYLKCLLSCFYYVSIVHDYDSLTIIYSHKKLLVDTCEIVQAIENKNNIHNIVIPNNVYAHKHYKYLYFRE